MRLDNRQESVTPHSVMGVNRLFGLHLLHPSVAQASNALRLDLEPGEAVIDGKVQYFPGENNLKPYDNSTLADGYEVRATVVIYYVPEVNGLFSKVITGTPGTTGSTSIISESALESAIGDYSYQICGDAKFVRSSSTVTLTLDRTRRSYELDPSYKSVGSSYLKDPVSSKSFYRPFQSLRLGSFDAADLANADPFITLPLPKIHGRITGGRVICEKAITTGSKTAALSFKIGSTAISGLAATYAGTKTIGAVTALSAASANNAFAPGDSLSLVIASVTAFAEGRLAIELDLEELVQ